MIPTAAILNILSIAGKVFVFVIPYAAIAGGFLWVMHLKADVATEKAHTFLATQTAERNAEAVKELEAAKALQDQVVADMGRDREARQSQYQQVRKEITVAPNSQSCIGSRPIAALLAGLRQGQPPSGTSGSVREGTPGSPRVQGTALRAKRHSK